MQFNRLGSMAEIKKVIASHLTLFNQRVFFSLILFLFHPSDLPFFFFSRFHHYFWLLVISHLVVVVLRREYRVDSVFDGRRLSYLPNQRSCLLSLSLSYAQILRRSRTWISNTAEFKITLKCFNEIETCHSLQSNWNLKFAYSLLSMKIIFLIIFLINSLSNWNIGSRVKKPNLWTWRGMHVLFWCQREIKRSFNQR
jgi:hypothetical protein